MRLRFENFDAPLSWILGKVLAGIDCFNSWDQFYGRSLDQRALVVTQSPLLALALYQAGRKEMVDACIGSLPLLPIDLMILRLSEQMPV